MKLILSIIYALLILLLILVFGSGCSPVGDGPSAFEVVDPVAPMSREPNRTPVLPEMRAYESFTSDAPETELAIARWQAATGMDIRLDDDGIVVELMPQVWAGKDGDNEVCGWARLHLRALWIATEPSVACPGLATTIAHEMGHALRGEGGHSLSGLMAPGSVHTWGGETPRHIDEASLDVVCALGSCPRRTPEHAP